MRIQSDKNTPNIKTNYFYNTFYQILTLITPLLTAPYVSRVLGASNIGIQSYTKSIVTYFTLFAALGTTYYGQREIAMHRKDKKESSKLFWEIEILSLFTTFITIIFWAIWIILARQYRIYYFVLTMEILSIGFDISWFFMGLEEFKFIVIRNCIVKIAGVAFIFLLVRKQSDLLVYIIINSLTILIGNLATWTYLPKVLVRVSRSELRPFRHLKSTFSYFIPTIASSIYTVLDKTMIGAITKSAVQNGYYEQAQKIVRMVISLLISLNTVMSSRMSFLFSENKIDEIKEKLDKSFGLLFLVAIPMTFGLIGISSNFVPWFFGEGYDGVVRLLCILSPLPFIITISNTLGMQYLTPSGQRVRSTKGIILGAVCNVIANSILIPTFSADGAALGTVIAEIIISSSYIYMSKGFISVTQLWSKTWKRLISSIIMLIFILIIGRNQYGSILITLVQVIIGVIVYFLLLFIMRDDDVKYLMSYLKKEH